MIKKVLLGVSITTAVIFCGLYLHYFHRAPVSSILTANEGKFSASKRSDDDYDDYDYDDPTTSRGSKKIWDKFIVAQKLVAIGEFYDKCGGKNVLTLGKIVLFAGRAGSLMCRAYFNITLERDVSQGEYYIEVDYNSRRLYDGHWHICQSNPDKKMMLMACPAKKGIQNILKEQAIPSFLPKGHYNVKFWGQDEDDNLFCCAKAEFKL